ncbi:MAG: VOC family protein [Granulosicoccus sp.]
MNASFGIDHPLLATHDIDGLRDRLTALGFNMTPIGKHPWGTSTSLAMFNGCLIEIMGIYDETLIDEVPAGEFRFGRHVYEHLHQREGVALTALHSTNSQTDAEIASRAGFNVAGHLEFGRDVTLPDGTAGRTKTTLALLPDTQFPRLSFFLCQQHRPELIYVQEWLQHPNKVTGICGVHIVASTEHHVALRQRFSQLYGGAETISGGFQCQSANGVVRIVDTNTFEHTIGPLPEDILNNASPCIVGMDLKMSKPQKLVNFLKTASLDYREIENGFSLMSPELTANTVLRFMM